MEALAHIVIARFQSPPIGEFQQTNALIGRGRDHRSNWGLDHSHMNAGVLIGGPGGLAECARKCGIETAIGIESGPEHDVFFGRTVAELGKGRG